MLSTRTNNNSSPANSSSSSPFTATQWQELEHQALIYKYMVSGLPIPPQLLSPLTWGCFHVGFAKKTDPEPGRCRRTDGKKWRCSKEAYPDSKYCERHMHRGKNRSRKPPPAVDVSSSSYAQSVLANMNLIHGHNQSLVMNPRDHNVFMDSASVVSSPRQAHPDYRYVHGVKEEDNMQQLSSSPSSSSKGYYCSPQSELESFPYPSKQDNYHHHNHNQQQQHCFVLGDDFKPSTSTTTSSMRPISYSNETQKPLHQFFAPDSWLDLASSSRPT